jgi:hypothetical protein
LSPETIAVTVAATVETVEVGMGVQRARQMVIEPAGRIDEFLVAPALTRQARRYRVAVVADSVADAVRAAGGSIVDRSLSGWDVTVFAGDPSDGQVSPVRILGAQARPLEDLVGSASPDVVIVSAAVRERDARVGEFVDSVLEAGGVPVVVWDPEPAPGGMNLRMSSAARVFKTRALAAAGVLGGPVGVVEHFRRA